MFELLIEESGEDGLIYLASESSELVKDTNFFGVN